MSIETWEDEGGYCPSIIDKPEKASDQYTLLLQEVWSKCCFCGARDGKFGRKLEHHTMRCRYNGPANEQAYPQCVECKARGKNVDARVAYQDTKDSSGRWNLFTNKLWCMACAPENRKPYNTPKPQPPIKPDKIILINPPESFIGRRRNQEARSKVLFDFVKPKDLIHEAKGSDTMKVRCIDIYAQNTGLELGKIYDVDHHDSKFYYLSGIVVGHTGKRLAGFFKARFEVVDGQAEQDQKDIEADIEKGFFSRGIGVHQTPCGIETAKHKRKKHDWVVVIKRENFWEFERFGEDYHGATALCTDLYKKHKIFAHTVLVQR